MTISFPLSEYDAPTRRSNKPVTAFACRILESFLLGKAEPGDHSLGNTSVCISETKSSTTANVKLFDDCILSVTLSLPDEEPIDVMISVGSFFTVDGYPTRTTAERLNGLLDLLGIHGIIPEKVRIFKAQENKSFVLGKGDQQIPIGKEYARNIRLKSDPDELIIESSDLGLECKQIKKKSRIIHRIQRK
jgi:hypothetical protein